MVREALFDRFRTVVLTSATLAVDGSFDYVKGRLGIRDGGRAARAIGVRLRTQALLYLPRRMPPPKSPAFAEAAARETIETAAAARAAARSCSSRATRCCAAVQRFVEMALDVSRCWCRARRRGPR